MMGGSLREHSSRVAIKQELGRARMRPVRGNECSAAGMTQ